MITPSLIIRKKNMAHLTIQRTFERLKGVLGTNGKGVLINLVQYKEIPKAKLTDEQLKEWRTL